MSKATKKAKQQASCKEAEYEKICRERQEQDELEVLNRKTEENLTDMREKLREQEVNSARMQKMLWEQEAKATHERHKQQKKLQALIDLVVLIFLSVVTCVALVALAYTGMVEWWLSIVLTMGLMMICSLRTGWLWHEIKI